MIEKKDEKFIEYKDKKFEYGKPLTVGQFQEIGGILGQTIESFEGKDDLTPGQFAGVLAEKGLLIDLICKLLKCDVTVANELEYSLVMEVINDFFFINGFWLMASGFIEMPSGISEVLNKEQQLKTATKEATKKEAMKMPGKSSVRQSEQKKKKKEQKRVVESVIEKEHQ